MIRFRIIEALLLVACVWRWKTDHFALLNQFADATEKRLPASLVWLGWSKGGNPISWAQHALWTILVALIGGCLAAWSSFAFHVGLREFATIMLVAFYLPRETWDARRHLKDEGWGTAFWVDGTHPYTGWLWDGIGDILGPALVVWLTWTL